MSAPRCSETGVSANRQGEDIGVEVDGAIDTWIPVVSVPHGPVVAVIGVIRGDRKNRWEDGTLIITSMIGEGEVIAPGAIIRTLNSTYRLFGQFVGEVTAYVD